MRKFPLSVTVRAAAAGAVLLLGSSVALATNSFDCSSSGKSHKFLRVVGLTADGYLVCFNEFAPRRTRQIGYVSGLVAPDTALIGIDFRVQDGLLYGVGNAGGVYRLDTTSAAATRVNALTVALQGSVFGVDFNPAADRLRIVSDTGQNLRHDVNTGATIADGGLNYTPGTAALGVTGVAYTNNDLDALTATTLFDVDTTLDQISIQSPPNNGSLGATGKLTVDAAAAAGFDIYSRLRKGVTVANSGYAVLNVFSEYAFYGVSLTTGKASFRGVFREPVVDVAVPLSQ